MAAVVMQKFALVVVCCHWSVLSAETSEEATVNLLVKAIAALQARTFSTLMSEMKGFQIKLPCSHGAETTSNL